MQKSDRFAEMTTEVTGMATCFMFTMYVGGTDSIWPRPRLWRHAVNS